MSGVHTEDIILETLADHGPLHVMEIAKETDNHPISVDRVCTHLYDAGHIYSTNRGYYRLTDHGRQRLTDDCYQSG